jgi:hypothetical protein
VLGVDSWNSNVNEAIKRCPSTTFANIRQWTLLLNYVRSEAEEQGTGRVRSKDVQRVSADRSSEIHGKTRHKIRANYASSSRADERDLRRP